MPFSSRPGHVQIARLLGAAGQQDGVELARADPPPARCTPTCALVWNSTPSARICSRRRSIEVLLHLEIRDAVAQQAADAVALFEHRDVVAGARQLLRRGQSRRARADHRDALAGAHARAAPAGSSLRRRRGR